MSRPIGPASSESEYVGVQSNEPCCAHGTALRFDCFYCSFDSIKMNNQGVCPHWVPKGKDCFACARLQASRGDVTSRPFIPIGNQQPQRIFTPTSVPGYVHPDEQRTDKPLPMRREVERSQVVGQVGAGPWNPPTDPRREAQWGRETPHRAVSSTPTQRSNMGVFMDRSLDDSQFFTQHGKAPTTWGNPVIKQNFPPPGSADNFVDSNSSMLGGAQDIVSSRNNRKNGAQEDVFLRRSMVQPDMRHGNRFYEIMPEIGRKQGTRSDDSARVAQHQQQSADIQTRMFAPTLTDRPTASRS